MAYNPQAIEPKWQKFWEENKTFKAEIDHSKEKFYVLDMFPYPSGKGLHVGHLEGYTATDITARYKRARGFNVLHTIGWDAFGLPAEQFAIKTGTHPKKTTEENIANFTRQIKEVGFSYDWDREINTTDPDYYKWTQWIFKKLYEKGLAYQTQAPVNWCPALKTVLANEEVIDGKSEIGSHPVERRYMRQWMLKITEYAEKLLEGLEDLDWPDSLKEMQRNWIGKSHGAEVTFKIAQSDKAFEVFTTRPDTLFGATYCVLAPEHPLVDEITAADKKEAVEAYKQECASKSELLRTELAKEKTGIFTGAYAVNPVNGKEIPIWIADYVMMGYGTGAIMAVPAHDQRDYEFAKKFEIEIIQVISGGDISEEAYAGDGELMNSEILDGLKVEAAKTKIISWLEEREFGTGSINYKMRDWLFSRQRYWGEPFPVLLTEDGTEILVEDSELPVRLPEVESYQPTGTGESPLAAIDDWINVTLPDGRRVKRDSNTMPQWAGSCWYYLRFCDPLNQNAPLSEEADSYWMPVDLYIGGAEHAVLHLLYARFWHRVLYDLGIVKTKEPFQKLVNQGIIMGEDGAKMSKSLGNIVNPDDVIGVHGADAIRVYEMFMGPLEKSKPWNTSGMEGINRFLKRSWNMIVADDDKLVPAITDEAADEKQLKLLHKTIKKVTLDLDGLRYNTAISQMMVFVNEMISAPKKNKEMMKQFVQLLAPFAPHVCEELWTKLGEEETVAYVPWPTYDEALCVEDEIKIPVQINGKVRANIMIQDGMTQDEVLELAKQEVQVQKNIEGKEIKKVIFVKNKIFNIVAK